MKKFVLIFLYSMFFNICIGQSRQNNIEQEKIKKTIVDFLKWYKQQVVKSNAMDTVKVHKSIVIWEQIDTLMKPVVDMVAVEDYLHWLKASNFISETFINNLRQYHQKIANELHTVPPYPQSYGVFAIPGLNLDVVFGSFEPEEILDRYKSGIFKRISIVHDKAIVQFYINKSSAHYYTKMIFTLTNEEGTWLIDYIGYYN